MFEINSITPAEQEASVAAVIGELYTRRRRRRPNRECAGSSDCYILNRV